MGESFPNILTMNIFLLISTFYLISAAPAPQEEDVVPYVHQEIEALPYVHDVTGDVSDDSSPEALPYVHDATGDVSDDSSPEALPYVHEGPVQAVAVPVASPVASPVLTYAFAPALTTYAAHLAQPATAGVKVAVVSPYVYAHTGCVNSVGSVVPCNV